MERPYFPMFVDLTGKNVLVAGGGRIALRRVTTLLRFGAAIRVVAPTALRGSGRPGEGRQNLRGTEEIQEGRCPGR